MAPIRINDGSNPRMHSPHQPAPRKRRQRPSPRVQRFLACAAAYFPQNLRKFFRPAYYINTHKKERAMKQKLTSNKTYQYPITSIAMDDDVYCSLKRIAKQRRIPAYRLASDVLRRWCKREQKKAPTISVDQRPATVERTAYDRHD
jgi:hypothetical protein